MNEYDILDGRFGCLRHQRADGQDSRSGQSVFRVHKPSRSVNENSYAAVRYCLTLAFAPLSIASRKSADGNCRVIALTRSSAVLAFASSSSKTNKYRSVKSTADVASIGAPALLCPGMTSAGFRSLILCSDSSQRFLALMSVSAV